VADCRVANAPRNDSSAIPVTVKHSGAHGISPGHDAERN
jgi:hypothetical protein